MQSWSIIHQASLTARRTVLLALFGAIVVLTALILKQHVFRYLNDASVSSIVAAHRAIEAINLGQEKLGNAALLAVETGDPGWIDQYMSLLPSVDRAMRQAAEIADTEVALAFNARTRASEQRRVAIEQTAFDLVRKGKLDAARALLADMQYLYHRRIVAEGTQTFVAGVMASAERQRQKFEVYERIGLAMLIPLALAAALILWRHLNASLRCTETVLLAAEDKIKGLAVNDVLTGLSNRTAIRERLRSAIVRAELADTKVAVLLIDLDRFKPLNDRHGQLIGDLVLKETGRRLSSLESPSVTFGRSGGDEFVGILECVEAHEMPSLLGQRIISLVSEPIAAGALSIDIAASVGIAVFPNDAAESDDLINKADIALRKAKSAGKGSVRAFDRDMDGDLKEQAELEAALPDAIRGGEIVPYFQPFVDLSMKRIVGFEVLARWQHPSKGLIAPVHFIAAAEKNGLIDDLMLSILRDACQAVKQLPDDVTLSVNVAPCQIENKQLTERLVAVLQAIGFPPQRLEVELTETALVSDIETAKSVIAGLKDAGVRVALDDFGTGYSSLSYLSDLPFDKIKIDRSFIKTVHERNESLKIVGAIIGLGRSLGASIVAEGIESERDETVLRGMGCLLAQGYLYSKPIPAEGLQVLMDRFSAPRFERRAAVA